MATGQYGLSRPYVGTFTCRECGAKFSRTSNQAACLIHKRKRDATAWYSPDTCGKCASYHGAKKAVAIRMKKVEEARKVFEESKSEIMLPDVFRINVPAMVFADPHIPFHSVPMMTRAIAVAEVNNIRRLCVDGDFVDNHFISDVFRESQSSSKMTGDEAYEVAEDIIGVLLKTFTGGIWFLEGNHEAWGEKILHGRLKIKTLAKMFGVDGKAKISPFDHGYVGDWCVIHGKNYSGIHPTTPPLRYCRIKDCSCIQGHQHLSGEAYTENGKHVAVPMGCMCDPKNMEYVQRKTTTNPKWMGEFVIIDGENRIHRFIDHPQKTNWNYVENVRTIR